VPKNILLPLVDRDALIQLVEKSAAGIGANIAAVVKTHVTEHLDHGGETWLAYGVKHIGADGECPFCAQETAKSDLVTAIRAYFSAEYRIFTESLFMDIQRIRERLGSTVFAQIRAGVAGQLIVAAQWNDVMPIDQSTLAATLDEAKIAWECGAAKVEAVVASKQAKPLDKIDPYLVEEAMVEYGRALAILANVNITLANAAKKAEERKAALTKADTTEIEKRLRRLESQKVRFEPAVQELLDKRNVLIEKRNKLDADKSVMKKEIEEHAAKVVGKYQDGINHYLAYFGCDTRIESVEPRFPGGKASVQYKLKAHGHEIELGFSDAAPCF
jgi:wobble nucleotide-excising tRNase